MKNKKCLECLKVFIPKYESNRFCSRSCSASYTNRVSPKRALSGECRICKVSILSNRKYCKEHKGTRIIQNKGEAKCLTCQNIYCKSASNQKYCSSICSNKAYNAKEICKNCDKLISRNSNSYLCVECLNKNKKEDRIKRWLEGEWAGGSERKLSPVIRRYILEQAEYKCVVCGWDEVHPDDGKTILEINHIDGDGSNHTPENLEVLCPNHHAMTSTYRNRNAGHGRSFYYVRVRK